MRPIEIRHIDHVVLRVRDVAASKRFYCDALGCSVERESEALGLYQLRAGASLIDLVPIDGPLGRPGGAGPGAEARNVDHVALALAHFDEAAIAAHLRSHGIDPGAVAERNGADGIGPSIYIRDPDGNVVELKGPGRAAERVYHLATASALRRDLRDGVYTPPSLATEGFIHCTATPALTLQVATDYFARVAEPLLVLAIDPARVRARLVFEAPAPIAGGGTAHLASGVLFPHLYGALEIAAVCGVAELRREGDAFLWPTAFGPLAAWLA